MDLSEKCIAAELQQVERKIRRQALSKGKVVTAFHLYQFVMLVHKQGRLQASLYELSEFFMLSTASMRRIIRRAENECLVAVEEQWTEDGASKSNVYLPYPGSGAGAPTAVPAVVTQSEPARELIPPDPPAPEPQDEVVRDSAPSSPERKVRTAPRKPDWLTIYSKPLYLDGWEPNKIADLVASYGTTKEQFENILATVRSKPGYWYRDVFVRSLSEGKPVPIDPDTDPEEWATFIREWTLLGAQRRKMREEVSQVLIYKRLERARLTQYATAVEEELWRKGRRVTKWSE